MKKGLIVGLMMLGLFEKNGLAQTKHCHTIEDCQNLKVEIEADQTVLLKNITPELTDIVKTGVSMYTAEWICADLGMRLPTARELALVSQSMGAQGISETKKDGYRLIKGSDIYGNPDHFYFSHIGYKTPAGDLGNKWFLSSSVHPDNSKNAYGLMGGNGNIDYDSRSSNYHNNAVRCVLSR